MTALDRTKTYATDAEPVPSMAERFTVTVLPGCRWRVIGGRARGEWTLQLAEGPPIPHRTYSTLISMGELLRAAIEARVSTAVHPFDAWRFAELMTEIDPNGVALPGIERFR